MSPLILSFLLLLNGYALAQECYAAKGKRIGSAVVPCGDTSEGVSACCALGDVCLSDGACWDNNTYVTYLYGCTDSNYADPNCPYKCGASFDEYWWVGLLYCGGDKNLWACNHADGDSQAIVRPPESAGVTQVCSSSGVLAFAGPSTLLPILQLPSDAAGTKEYFSSVNPTSWTAVPNYTPASTFKGSASVPPTVIQITTVTATDTVSASASSSSQTSTQSTSSSSVSTTASSTSSVTGEFASTRTSSPTPSSTPSAVSTSGGLSTGAKAGIGAGVGGVALALIIIFAIFCMRRRRRSKDKSHTPAMTSTPVARKYTYERAPASPPGDQEIAPRYSEPSELPGSQQHLAAAGTVTERDSTRWSNSNTISSTSWGSPKIGTDFNSRSSVSPTPPGTNKFQPNSMSKQYPGVHELS